MALEFFTGAVVSSLFQDFIDKIRTCTIDQICHAFSDVEEKLKVLERSYLKAQSMVDHVDGWEMVTNKPYRGWVGDVMRACYDMEDLTLHVTVELRKAGNGLPFLKNWVLSREMDELQTNLDQVSARVPECLTYVDRSSIPSTTTVAREHVIVPLRSEKFSRQREKEEIVKFLLHPANSSRNIYATIAIQGMFGLGKTVLAQAVTNDARIQAHFKHICWVPVSGDFNLEKVISSIASQAHVMQLPTERETVVSMLQSRRVLIVLDDVHRLTSPQDWQFFRSLGRDAFSVIITTRNPKVARKIKTSNFLPVSVVPYYLQWMSDQECQSLIINRAKAMLPALNNPSEQKLCTQEGIALKIAEKFCKGLPLVADVIGLHLSSKFEDRWISMLSRNLWDIPEFKEQIFPAFGSDFSGFPRPLKHCFYYLSLFPSEFNFTMEELAQLWMAEGFIQPKVAREPYQYTRLEEIGYDYFDDLVSRSILQLYNPSDGEPQVYRVHEIIHRYAQYVSSDVYLRLDEDFVDTYSVSRSISPPTYIYATWFKKARHISLLCASIAPSIMRDLENCKALRTILSLHQQRQTRIGPLSYKLFLNLRSLRVLSLSNTDIRKLPESIGQLKYLQLLDLSGTNIQDLPASTTELQRLKVLKLKDCPELLRLPKNIKNLTNLLHLEVDVTLSSMPPKMGKLKNIQTLPVFIAGNEEGYLISELKHMTDLKGLIRLKNLENVTGYSEAWETMLSNKSLLKKLELEWESSSMNDSVAEEILSGLQPHENLEDLRVVGFDGVHFPTWLTRPECGLTSIHLEECRKCTFLPPLGHLQHLRELHIQGLHGVRYVNHQFSSGGGGSIPGFPSLLSLKFQDMKNLETWNGLLTGQMPRLRELMIMDCPKLITLPSIHQCTCLECLEICDCPNLQSLPEEGLPQSLKSLIIVSSDLVQQRCQPKEGADWNKVKRVPELVIDFVQIKTVRTRRKRS